MECLTVLGSTGVSRLITAHSHGVPVRQSAEISVFQVLKYPQSKC